MECKTETNNSNGRNYEYYGAHITDGVCVFCVWAPDVKDIYVFGDFNGYVKEDPDFKMKPNGVPGEFELTKKGIDFFSSYKYLVITKNGKLEKADPYSFCTDVNDVFTSKIYDHTSYLWHDSKWLESRKKKEIRKSPMNIYECHIGSWKRKQDGSFLSYRELAEEIVPYVKENGYTHIELMPVMEHPFYGSWGYEITGYFAPSSRYGSPDGLKYFVDYCHCHGIGVIFDWQACHFPKDEQGLYRFNGDWLYEYSDESRRELHVWGTCMFDLSKESVRSFLISSALFWIDKYHIDGLRTDAVSPMLLLDFGRDPGQWNENDFGGRENIDAIGFLRQLNKSVSVNYPDVFTIAEESNAWPMVTRAEQAGGLGFTFKWNMGWSHDTIEYAQTDPFFRKNNHKNIVFPASYAFSETFILPFSHDDVSAGRKSMFKKMAGNAEDRFSELRLFAGYKIAFPGKKLTFMGNEFGYEKEWDHDAEQERQFLYDDDHARLLYYIKELNYFYLEHPSLWKDDDRNKSFRWISNNDVNQNIIVFIRQCDEESLIFLFNFAPVTRYDYRIGVPENCEYTEIFSSDETRFGGTGITNGSPDVYPFYQHGMPQQIALTVPPISMICLQQKKTAEYKS
jgi:1,4-alpha-glucan branching enzyme